MIGGRLRRITLVCALTVIVTGSGGFATTSVASPRAPGATVVTNSATIQIGKDAQHHGYDTTQLTMTQGGSLSVVNFDAIQHTVTSKEKDANGRPLFNVFVDPG